LKLPVGKDLMKTPEDRKTPEDGMVRVIGIRSPRFSENPDSCGGGPKAAAGQKTDLPLQAEQWLPVGVIRSNLLHPTQGGNTNRLGCAILWFSSSFGKVEPMPPPVWNVVRQKMNTG